MKKLYRSAMFAGVLAIGVAACGDDVTIVDQPAPPPPPLQVTMTPAQQSIGVNAVADFAVGVSGGAEGAQASWTCSSSATGVATVATTATGCRATGVAAGSASITVTVEKGNQSANAGAQVIVTAPPAMTPATISIAGVNQGGLPADLEDISGQVDVTLNVDPKDDTIERVVLYVDGVEVAAQVWAAAIEAMDEPEVGEAMQQVTLSFRTDFYSINTSAGTATPRHMNGDRVISAALEVAGTEADRPSNTVPVRFNNTSGFHVTTDITTKPSEIDGNGFIWYGGPDFGTATVTAYPVLYGGGTVNSVSMNMCGSSNSMTTAPFAFTRTCATTESSAVTPSFSSIVSNEPGPSAILNGTARFGLTAHPFPVRIDRVAPAGGAIAIARIASVGNRANWVNGAYTFSSGYTNASDAGVGCATGCARTFRVRQGATVIADDVTTPADIPNSLTNEVYNVQAVVRDRLGNSRVISQSAGAAPNALATFGVDKNAPQLQWDTMDVDAIRRDTTTLNISATEQFDVRALDNVSGFGVPASYVAASDTLFALEHTLVRVTANYLASPTALARTAVVGSGTLSSTPFAAAAAGNFVAPNRGQVTTYVHSPTLISFSQPLGAAVDEGYYIYQARARDQAGNVSSTLARLVYVNNDLSPTIVQGLQTAISLPWNGGDDIEFQAVADDAVEIVSKSFGLRYPNVEQAGAQVDLTVWNATTAVSQDGVKFNDVIVRPQFLTFNTGALIRSLTGVDADDLPAGTINRPDMADARVNSGFPSITTPWQTGLGIVSTSAAIAPAQVSEPDADIWNDIDFGDPATNDQGWMITSATFPTSGTTRTVTLTIQARGSASTFVNPFTAVAVVTQDGGNVRVLGFATPTPNDGFPAADDGIRRDWRWTFTAPGTASGTTFHAVGLNSSFDGLVTLGETVVW